MCGAGCMGSGDSVVGARAQGLALSAPAPAFPCEDWWDGSAVDGWTVPFSVLTENDGWPLTPPQNSSLPPQPDTGPAAEACGDVICAKLDAAKLCPHSEFMTPQWQ